MTNQEYTERLGRIMRGEAEIMAVTAPVVAMFLERFRPVDPPAINGDNMTSREIASTLEDIAEIPYNDIAEVMHYLGYRLVTNEYRGIEWSMSAVTEG